MKKQQATKNKIIPIVAGAFILVAAGIGLTLAYNQDSSVLENVFKISDYKVEYMDTFQSPSNWLTGETVAKEIKVKNDTSTPVVARVKLTETWDSKDGVGLPLVGAQSNVRMAIVNYTENSGWTLDGTWYYSPVLQPGETSTSLISGVTLNEQADLAGDWRYGGATYKLSAKAEVIQSEFAATEWHKKVVVSPSAISRRAWELNGNASGEYDFVRVEEIPSFVGSSTDSEYRMQTTDNESNTPFYLWISGDSLFWYSDADDIYLIDGTFSYSFLYFKSMKGLKDFNTSRLTTMQDMFTYSKPLSLEGLEDWDVSHITSFRDAFYSGGDGGIRDISALSRWDVSNVTDVRYMFSGHKIADVSSLAAWNVRNITDFTLMFVHNKIDDSICSLADWPIRRDASGFGIFETTPDVYPVDARCLEPWSINYDKASDWFSSHKYIWPSWAH